jgi:hypothetical protein
MEEERKDQEQEEREETVKDLEVSDEQAEDVKGGARNADRFQK